MHSSYGLTALAALSSIASAMPSTAGQVTPSAWQVTGIEAYLSSIDDTRQHVSFNVTDPTTATYSGTCTIAFDNTTVATDFHSCSNVNYSFRFPFGPGEPDKFTVELQEVIPAADASYMGSMFLIQPTNLTCDFGINTLFCRGGPVTVFVTSAVA